MSFFVKADGNIFIERGTCFPGKCPECPAYIPILSTMTLQTSVTCWNCKLEGPLELFIQDDEYEFLGAKEC